MTRTRLVVTVLPVVLLVLTVALGVLGARQHDVRQEQQEQARSSRTVLRLAHDQVRDLTTLSPASLDRTLERMVARTSGEFKDQLEGLLATFAEVVESGEVTTTGRVDSAAVSSLGRSRARVLVAATATVGSKTQEAVRTYRIEVGLDRASGAWLIDSMEFVG